MKEIFMIRSIFFALSLGTVSLAVLAADEAGRTTPTQESHDVEHNLDHNIDYCPNCVANVAQHANSKSDAVRADGTTKLIAHLQEKGFSAQQAAISAGKKYRENYKPVKK